MNFNIQIYYISEIIRIYTGNFIYVNVSIILSNREFLEILLLIVFTKGTFTKVNIRGFRENFASY